MHKVSLALAVAGTSFSLLAQNCNTSPPQGTLTNYPQVNASFYSGTTGDISITTFFDLNLQTPITVSQLDLVTYAQGVGSPVVPDQQGNVVEVRVFAIPGTYVGNEGTAPVTPPVPGAWLEIARGEMLIVAYPGFSPITAFKDPVTLNPFPNGELVLDPTNPLVFDVNGDGGFAIEVISSNANSTPVVLMNPGSVPMIGYTDPNPTPSASNQFFTLDAWVTRNEGWFDVDGSGNVISNPTPSGIGTARPNIGIEFTPDASAAISIEFGTGCYDRPQAVYEFFPEGFAWAGDLEGTSWTLIPQGSPQTNYILVPGSTPYAVQTGTNLAAGTPTSSYTAALGSQWDDACLTQALGFTFPHPGGTTSDITINSNGKIYLGLTTDATFETCGSNYGSTQVLRDGPPSGPLAQICAFNADFDPDVVTGGGAIFFSNPTATSAMITWQAVPNWPVVANENNWVQLTLYDSGQIDIAYGDPTVLSVPGTLFNTASQGNTCIVGYSRGDGTDIGDSIDWSAQTGLVTGDGSFPPTAYVDGRPVAGTTVDVVLDNLTPGTTFGIVVIALNGVAPPGFDLGTPPLNLGMPGCSAFVNPPSIVTSVFLAPVAGEMRWAWNVPTGYNGVQSFFQYATLTPGLNAAGILVSNAICAKVGT